MLAVSLRIQINPKNEIGRLPERAFADYVFAMIILFIAVFSFMG